MKRFDNDLIHIKGTNIHANEAGLKWLAELRAQPKDPHTAYRCFWADFQCPFLRRGQGTPCISEKGRQKELVRIGTWNWQQEKRPIGQMSLFEPRRTHKNVWVNVVTGKEQEAHPNPVFAMVSCKEMAYAHVKWLETRHGWNPLAWRIIPLTNFKSDIAWKEEQIAKHGLKACVFDTI